MPTQEDLTESQLVSTLRWYLQKMRTQNERDRDIQLDQVAEVAQNQMQKAESEYQKNVRNVVEEFDALTQSLLGRLEKAIRGIDNTYKAQRRLFSQQLLQLESSLGPGCWAWDSPRWSGYYPNQPEVRNWTIRVGTLGVDPTLTAGQNVPALINLGESNHIVVHSFRDAELSCRPFIQNILLRLLVAFPSRLLKFHLIDPLGLGSNVEIIQPGRNSVCSNVISDKRQIEDFLFAMTQHITHIRSNLLGSRYSSIDAYNDAATGHHLEHHFIVLLDFPKWYTQEAVSYLVPIIRSGLDAGVNLIMHSNDSVQAPGSWNWDSSVFGNRVLRFNISQSDAIWNVGSLAKYKIKLDNPPEATLISRILDKANTSMPVGVTDILSFESIAVPSEKWGMGDSTTCLVATVGIDETGTPFQVVLGRDDSSIHHGIIGGTTGSGKGNFLRVLITQLICKYPPEELQLYLMDFKQSQDLGNYQQTPTKHIHTLVSGYDPYSGLAILRWLIQEKSRRSVIFNGAVKLEEYRAAGNRQPRILVIIDEFPKLLNDTQFGGEAKALLNELAKEGRAYGIHIFLSAQTIEDITDMGTAYGQLGLRICLKVVNPSHSEKILGHGNQRAVELEQVGLAIVNESSSQLASRNSKVKIAYLENGKQPTILAELQSKYGRANTRVIGVHKSKKIPVRNLSLLSSGLTAGAMRSNSISLLVGLSSALRFGESGDIEEDTELQFREERGSNLLVIGPNLDQSLQLLQGIAISLYCQPHHDCRISIAVGAKLERPARLALGSLIENTDFSLTTEVLEEISRINQIIQERVMSSNDTARPLFFCCFGLGRMSLIKDQMGGSSQNLGTLISGIVRRGPEVGVFSMIWAEHWDDMNLAGMRNYEEFRMRIALSGLTTDATKRALDLTASTKIELSQYAHYRNIVRTENADRFLPYTLLSNDEIQQIRKFSRADEGT